MRRVFVVSVMVVCLVAVGAQVAYAAPVSQEVPSVPAFIEVLGMLAKGLGVGSILAFLFERFAWFQAMGKEAKWWVVFCTSLGLPVLAQVLLQFVPAEVWAGIEPYWRSVALGFLSWSGSQVVHMVRRAVDAYSAADELVVDIDDACLLERRG